MPDDEPPVLQVLPVPELLPPEPPSCAPAVPPPVPPDDEQCAGAPRRREPQSRRVPYASSENERYALREWGLLRLQCACRSGCTPLTRRFRRVRDDRGASSLHALRSVGLPGGKTRRGDASLRRAARAPVGRHARTCYLRRPRTIQEPPSELPLHGLRAADPRPRPGLARRRHRDRPAALPEVLPKPFTVLTAYNPRSMLLPRKVNDGRHKVLRDLLILGGYRVERCVGFEEDPEGTWREPAWLVHRMDREEAIAFGRVFRQNAVRVPQPHRALIVTDPTCDDVGKTYVGNWRVESEGIR